MLTGSSVSATQATMRFYSLASLPVDLRAGPDDTASTRPAISRSAASTRSRWPASSAAAAAPTGGVLVGPDGPRVVVRRETVADTFARDIDMSRN